MAICGNVASISKKHCHFIVIHLFRNRHAVSDLLQDLLIVCNVFSSGSFYAAFTDILLQYYDILCEIKSSK